MPEIYRYVGPVTILERVEGQPPGELVRSPKGLARAVRDLGGSRCTELVVTWTLDEHGQLWVADRHSEHVACAGHAPVLGAGEMTIPVRGERAEITHLTHQSTGYCPEPECWPAVDQALSALGLPHPPAFSLAFTFRRCERCATIHVVKEGWLECACGAPLPEHPNLR